jgi:electron transport complex protein RnfC
MGPSFKGGVATPHHKEATEHAVISRAPVPERLVVPLSQHLGAPCEPTVAKGDHVERGQLIGDVEAFISAPVHAPAAGTVSELLETVTPAGTRSQAIAIEVEGDQELERFAPVPDEEDRIARVRAAGVVGMGGAMFPASVKLKPPREFTLDTVILNGCECEPFLTCDYRTMVETPDRVVAGGRLIADLTGVSRAVIGVEDDKPEAVEALRAHARSGVEVVPLKTKYPQGAEKQLIMSILGKEVPKGQLPAATGALVHNVGTAVAIADAVERRRPLIERVVTVTGAVRRPGNYLTLVGTSIADLVEHAGGLEDDVEVVIAGGPMTGFALASLDVPVVKGTSGVVALRSGEIRPVSGEDQPCIRCGRCPQGCPMFLQPFAIASHAGAGDWEGAHAYHALDCIECGACSYVCPTRRPLLQLIRVAKHALLERGERP